jgi:hypothetical protein
LGNECDGKGRLEVMGGKRKGMEVRREEKRVVEERERAREVGE